MTESIKLGEQLYRMLPEVYRTRDKITNAGEDSSGDKSLERYLDAHGHLLDLIHATLEQQLKDALPESSQEWLLPYFAQLLATNIVSPDAAGKHAEVAKAVAWRQRKGTLKCAEEIAEAVGQMEVEIQEGWKRVAMTPHIGTPLIPAIALDDTFDLDMNMPSEAIRHPGLPAAMIDLRRSSRAVEALKTNPAAKSSNFGGIRQTWRQTNRHGVPCFPNSFEDVSRRMVDVRTPEDSNGRYQHKSVMLFAPPPTGFFGLEPLRITWDLRNDSLYEHYFEEEVSSDGVVLIRNRTERIIEITDIKVKLETKSYRIEGINFQGALEVPAGGKLELTGVEADVVDVITFSTDEPVLTACDCLFRVLSSGGLVKLDSCTVLEEAFLPSLEALDCVFMDIQGTNITGIIEYSRIPDNTPLSTDITKVSIKSHQFNSESEYGYDPVIEDPSFISGQPNSLISARSVLSPSAPKSVYEGASDHGEMGYYHRGRRNGPVHITGDPPFLLPVDGGYPLADVIFDHDVTVNDGQLVLIRSAAPTLTVTTPLNDSGEVIPSLSATDCLFQNINVADGLARLEYCTIMDDADCKHLQASDCIFVGTISGVEKWDEDSMVNQFINCLRYSSINFIDAECMLTLMTNTNEQPIFSKFRFCSELVVREAVYREWGYGVLGPLTPRAVRFGAEDGGEMGAFHHRYYTLKAKAMLKKMREFLPVGLEPIMIQDERLLHEPPEKLTTTSPT